MLIKQDSFKDFIMSCDQTAFSMPTEDVRNFVTLILTVVLLISNYSYIRCQYKIHLSQIFQRIYQNRT